MLETRPITRELPSVYYFSFPSPESTVSAVHKHTARAGVSPPEIFTDDDQVLLRSNTLFSTHIASLKATLWRTPVINLDTIKKLKERTWKLSFVLHKRLSGLERALTDSKPHNRKIAHYLSRPILQHEVINPPKTELKFINLNFLSGDRFMAAWEDFAKVYTLGRLTGTPTRPPDRIEVVTERKSHIWQRLLMDKRAAVFVGYLDKKPVATGSVWPMFIDGVRCLQFADINTHPDFQGLGLGKAMLNQRLHHASLMDKPSLAFSYVFEEEGSENVSMNNLTKRGFQPWFKVLYMDLPHAE